MNLCRDHLAETTRRGDREVSFDQRVSGDDAPEGVSLWEVYQPPAAVTGQGEASPESDMIEKDMHDRLMEMLSCLPQMQREALLFHYLYDMKYREIAKQTGVSVSTVKSRVKQGMEKLRGVMRKEDFE